MVSRVQVLQAVLTADGAVLLCHGAVSLFVVVAPPGEPYFSTSLVVFGVLPAILGVVSLACAVSLSFRPPASAG